MFELTPPMDWPAKSIEVGRYHVCGVFEGPSYDEVWCKGDGENGQLGDGMNTNSNVLVKVLGLPEKRIIDLGFASFTSCAVTEDNKVYCWGDVYIPMNSAIVSSTAIETPLIDTIEIKGSTSTLCALKTNKSLWCWELGVSGKLGQNNTLNSKNTPLKVKDSLGTGFLGDVSDFAIGHKHSCAITLGKVYCWGLSYLCTFK